MAVRQRTPAALAGRRQCRPCRDFDRVDAWLPGTVPGTVQSDLLSLGHIPDPFLEDNLAACQWVEGLDWWYRAGLPLHLDPGQHAFLEFDGIDTLSALFVDGQELGRHEGMFSRQTVEIPPALAAKPEAELAVRLWGSDALPRYELTAGEQRGAASPVWRRAVFGPSTTGWRRSRRRCISAGTSPHACGRWVSGTMPGSWFAAESTWATYGSKPSRLSRLQILRRPGCGCV